MQQNDIMEHITYHASDCKEVVLTGDDDMTDGETGWLLWPSEMAAGGGGFGTNSCTAPDSSFLCELQFTPLSASSSLGIDDGSMFPVVLHLN